ncbi:MAG: hypothetical protein UV75_C0006G0002 [Candidatus Giovannonibacteria bacterium GW2011_GWA1_43_15]|uniref:Uncharacterized protein n=1 Tax=Candidatus Giovannonibacteria bacterium GW2011_GWA2_44_26 TaxID=1618648 RepID=A0A0G1L3W4_9BACT|nr:MAG: hypothetical protein UV72_C0004G0002 [Candidatus Giovannonibacteria bacterium GW2011_GWB1_43_13]KKS99313.1 MAG: hypothetical protein UV75_C0006G0002 [Candidatus Giovannonibacteria bacterium GW2011_GWA1_43_15]KKT63287.1 MAG: hypothetical protein UW55_C0005G0002 [Candidatus Giovannonibacteria bacterium GW2011_GWA2_44_26]
MEAKKAYESKNRRARVVREIRPLRGNAKHSNYRNPPVNSREPGVDEASDFR